MSVLWLTHAESMTPAQQRAEVAKLQREYPWAGRHVPYFFDGHGLLRRLEPHNEYRLDILFMGGWQLAVQFPCELSEGSSHCASH